MKQLLTVFSLRKRKNSSPSKPLLWAHGYFARAFGIDLRSLALFCIGLALVVLADLIRRAFDLEAHYTDNGILPRSVLIDNFLANHAYFSLHLIVGTTCGQAALFLIASVFALMLLVGYRTRLATFVSWLLLVSLQARNPLITHGADDVMRLLLFWSMFLPLGARCSLDSAWQPQQQEENGGRAAEDGRQAGNEQEGKASGKASSHKDNAEGDAANNQDSYRHESTNARTAGIVSMGTVCLLLQICFIYWFSALLKSDPIWRRDGTAVWYALHLGQFVTPLGAKLLAWPALLHALTFATLFMEGFAAFAAFTPLLFGPTRTLVVILFLGFHLGLALCLELGLFSHVCAVAWLVFLPAWFWQRLASKVRKPKARLRQFFARWLPVLRRWPVFNAPAPIPLRLSPAMQALAGLLLVYVLLWNARTTNFPRYERLLPRRLNWIGEVTKLQQSWGLFAPAPLQQQGWYVIPATLQDGMEVDLSQDGAAVSWTAPTPISATYRNDRWRRYLMNLWLVKNSRYRRYYVRYLCRKWNEAHGADKQITALQIYYMKQDIALRPPESQPSKVLLWQYERETTSALRFE